jgi:hypothetical protein
VDVVTATLHSLSDHRHPDAPAWLPDTFCLTCNKMAETISYIDYSEPGFQWVRLFKVRCHGESAEWTGPTAFAPESKP